MNNPKRLIAKQPKTFYLTVPALLLAKYTFRACLANQIDRILPGITETSGITREGNKIILSFNSTQTNLDTIPRIGKECLLIVQLINAQAVVVNQLLIPVVVYANLMPVSI